MIEPGDQPTSVPYLNVVPVNELFGGHQGGGIIRVIAQKTFDKNKTMAVNTENIGAIVRHCCSPGISPPAEWLVADEAEIGANPQAACSRAFTIRKSRFPNISAQLF
jgi:hypothetical protein